MIRKCLLAAPLAALASTALAGSPEVAPEPVVVAPEPFSWQGGYAGLQAGYLDSDIELTGRNLNNGNTMSSSDIDASGFVGGVYGGYNWHTPGNLVYGVEGEFNFSDADETGAGVPSPSFGFLRGSVSSEIDSTAALRARLGIAADRTLFYVAGGLAYADISVDGRSQGGGSPFGYSEGRWGWTIGAGVEYAFGDNWVGRLDYRYSDFGDDSFNFTSVQQQTPHRFEVETETHEIKAGLAYRF